jgi:hypothetical protein
MGISVLENQYTINGVISTDDTVLQNMEKLCASAGCWLTYDIHAGLWSVIINQAGNSVASFNDSNIIGPLNVQSTGLTELYNGVKVSYPRGDINDQIDFVQVDLPANLRNTNEPDNVLEITLDLCNDPVQAELIAVIELRQDRLDKVVTFQTDYTAIDINAGDIIDITSAMYSWSAKEFRVISMREVDDDNGAIRIELTVLEYDDSIYDPDLSRLSRSNQNGIVTTGAIGTPAAPQITRFERDARPRLLFEAITPTGIVEGMEFWYSQTSNVAGFELVGTTFPVAGGSYGSNQQVEFDVDWLNTGNVYVKTRGINSSTTGEFSAVTADTYSPVQVTAAVNPNTEITDLNGNLITTAALTTLLSLLDGLYSDSATGNTSLFAKIFDILQTENGVDLTQPGSVGFNTVVANTTPIFTDSSNTLSILPGTNITITGNDATNTLTINSTGGAGGSLASLSDVQLTSPVNGNILKYNGTKCVNSLDLWEGSRKYVSSTTPASPSNGDIWFKI